MVLRTKNNPTRIPIVMPISRSESRIAAMVTAKGINWSFPFLYMEMMRDGFASLYPTINRMAARQASGILLSRPGIRPAVIKSRNPCTIADVLVLAPAATLAELLTITAVTGSPPIKPLTILARPCALSSWFSGELRL